MNAITETLGVAFLALLGVYLGRFFSRLKSPWWLMGYLLPLTVIICVGAARRISQLEFVPPCSWFMTGRTEFALTGIVTTMVLFTPLSRLPKPTDRRAVVALATLVVFTSAIYPFLAPAFNWKYLASLRTKFDRDGVCLQSTDYTCGPAAAVTALRRLDIAAEEGELAVLCHTTDLCGTPPDILNEVLNQRYSGYGLTSRYQHFASIDALPQNRLALAVIKYGFLVDHYVTILRIDAQNVIVGDPAKGMVSYAWPAFEKIWRKTCIVLDRPNPTTLKQFVFNVPKGLKLKE